MAVGRPLPLAAAETHRPSPHRPGSRGKGSPLLEDAEGPCGRQGLMKEAHVPIIRWTKHLGTTEWHCSGFMKLREQAKWLPLCGSVFKQVSTINSLPPKSSLSIISLDFNIVKALLIGGLNTHVMNPISHKELPAPKKPKGENARSCNLEGKLTWIMHFLKNKQTNVPKTTDKSVQKASLEHQLLSSEVLKRIGKNSLE